MQLNFNFYRKGKLWQSAGRLDTSQLGFLGRQLTGACRKLDETRYACFAVFLDIWHEASIWNGARGSLLGNVDMR